jgi:hypothetical protein
MYTARTYPLSVKGQWEKGDKCGKVAGVGMCMGKTRQQQNMNILHFALNLAN